MQIIWTMQFVSLLHEKLPPTVYLYISNYGKKRKRGVGVYREGESDKSQDQRPSSSEEVGKLKMDRDR